MNKLTVLVAALALTSTFMSAAIVDRAVYHLDTNGAPTDSSGNGLDFASESLGITAQTTNPSPVSSTHVHFSGAGTSSATWGADWSAMPADNFAIEMWINYDGTNSSQMDIFASSGENSGPLKFSISAGGYLVSGFHNSTWIDQTGVPLASDTWVHLAVVRNNGTLASYINGVDSGMNTTTAAIPFGVAHLGIQPFSGNLYTGLMDELRIFSFESGDDYVAAFNIPEPATMSLLALGGLAILRRRKK